MNIKTALEYASRQLGYSQSNSALIDAEILLLHCLNLTPDSTLQLAPDCCLEPKCKAHNLAPQRSVEPVKSINDRAWLYSHPNHKLTPSQIKKYNRLINRRTKMEPIAYIIGRKEFYNLKFLVNKHTIIPRPETELMVEEVLDQLSTSNYQLSINKKLLLIDVGAGTGCIPISILNDLRFKIYDLNMFNCYAIDTSKQAINIARKNARLHQVANKIKFLRGNLIEPIMKKYSNVPMSKYSCVIITANLPYLAPKIYQENYSQLKFEPRSALVAPQTGLALYKQLLIQIKSLIAHYSFPITIYFELLPSQIPQTKKIIKQNFPNSYIQIKKDLAGLDRLVIINSNGN